MQNKELQKVCRQNRQTGYHAYSQIMQFTWDFTILSFRECVHIKRNKTVEISKSIGFS